VKNQDYRAIAWTSVLLLCFAAAETPAFAQFSLPAGAHVDLYFPQVANGGDASARWQTTFQIVNPNPATATGRLSFFGQDGQPLVVEFGTAVDSVFTITVPGSGAIRFRTSGNGALRNGWAFATFDRPVQASATYRALVNNVPRLEASVNAVLPTPETLNFATAFSGVAIANPWSNINISFTVGLNDAAGRRVTARQITLGPLQQTARVVSDLLGVPSSFAGSIWVEAQDPQAGPVVLVLNADGEGTISSLPSGNVAGFIADQNAIRMVFRHLLSVLNAFPDLAVGNPTLRIESNRNVNAFATREGTVAVELGLAQLFGNLDELAFIVGHELGHIYQFSRGRAFADPSNPESDADLFGLVAILLAGYDPYAAGGAFGKLMMATGRGSLLVQAWEDQNAADAHRSFSTRIQDLYQALVAVCSDPSLSGFCADYNRIFHPNVPGPLRREDYVAAGGRIALPALRVGVLERGFSGFPRQAPAPR